MIDYMQKQTKLIEEAFNTDTRFTTARDKVGHCNFNSEFRLLLVISRLQSLISDLQPDMLIQFCSL